MDDISLLIRRCKRGNETKLDLSGRNITSIPQEVFQLTTLESLDLSNNKLAHLDPKISNLTALRNLNVNNNNLLTIPQSLLSLNFLEHLDLLGNPLAQQFELLLKKENCSGSKLHSTLRVAFGLDDNKGGLGKERDEKRPESAKPSWLDGGSSSNQTALVNKLMEAENLLSIEQHKNAELEKKLEKLRIESSLIFDSKIEKKSLLNMDASIARALEVDYADLTIGDIISQGGFSIVHRGEFRGCDVAIKKIFDPVITQELLSEISNEVQMMSNLRHPNILLLMGIVTKPPNLCIISEYISNGSLFDLLHKNKKEIKIATKLELVRQVARVMYFIHSSKVVHRDLKSHNVLLDESHRVKLCDFGLARNFCDLNIGPMQFSGTPSYLAPEVFHKKAYDHKIDVYAFGTLLWEVFAREIPFEGLDPTDVMLKVTKNEGLNMKGLPKEIVKIVNDCRSPDSSRRPEFVNILKTLNSLNL